MNPEALVSTAEEVLTVLRSGDLLTHGISLPRPGNFYPSGVNQMQKPDLVVLVSATSSSTLLSFPIYLVRQSKSSQFSPPCFSFFSFSVDIFFGGGGRFSNL